MRIPDFLLELLMFVSMGLNHLLSTLKRHLSRKKYDVSKIPEMAGKVVVVTGANSGIGKISAMEMARKGAHVILACRSAEKTLPVINEIKEETKNDKVEFMRLDLSSLRSIEEFSAAFHSKNLPLHILLNNAGIMMVPFSLTVDGIESQFGTNHVGHFFLTQLLFDVLEKSQPSRVVCLTSMGHELLYPEGIRFGAINNKKGYSESWAYGQSKLSNLLFARELAKRCEGKQIYVNAVHPGYVATELQRYVYANWNPLIAWGPKVGHLLLALTPEQGALTQLYACTHPEIEEKEIRGKYLVPIAREEESTRTGSDMKLAAELWRFTEEMLREKLGERYKSQI